jgi:periplasmic copper chaperone A
MRVGIFLLISLLSLSARADLLLQKGYVRGLPPGQNNTAAFLTLKNTGPDNIVLTSAKSNVAASAELHLHSMSADGVMSMAEVPAVSINAGQTFRFEPGAYHIMLLGLHKPLQPAQQVEMQLIAQDGSVYRYTLPVISVLDEPAANAHH